MRSLLILSITLTLLFTASADAQTPPGAPGDPLPAGSDVTVQTQSPDDTLHVAQETTVEITVTHPDTITLKEPILPDTGRIQVLTIEHSTEATGDGLVIDRFRVHVVLFHIGRFYFPPLRMLYADPANPTQLRYVESQQQSLKVASAIAEDREEAELRPPRDPTSIMEADWRPLIWGSVAFGILLCLGIGWLLSRRFAKREKPVFAAPAKPAWEVARARLRELSESDMPGQGFVREYYFELSEIVREYLGTRFGLQALEYTTSELLEYFESRGWPRGLESSELETFLLDCDLVKFARYQPAETMITGGFETASQIVERTLPTRPDPTKAAESGTSTAAPAASANNKKSGEPKEESAP